MNAEMEYTFLEHISHKTLLGIRFWDAAMDKKIGDGLRVTLHSTENIRKKIPAQRTRSDVYAFNHIPGMIFQETTADDDISSPNPTQSFIVKVSDTQNRFSEAAFMVDLPLPYNGIFLVDDTNVSPSLTPRGFNLYSSATRSATSQFTFLRGELIDRTTDTEASYAVVRVQDESGFSWYGIADEDGKFAVMLPYPPLNISFGSSPPSSDGVRLADRTWTVTVAVMYEPLNRMSLPGTDLPEYTSILSQGQALIYAESPDTDIGEVSELQAELVYGRDLVITTTGFSELYVSASGSPA